MTLHTPHRNAGSSRYCGPTAIMAVTGAPGSAVKDAIRQARGNIQSAAGTHMPVAGVSNADLIGAMAHLGWAPVEEWKSTITKGERVKLLDPKGDWHGPGGERFFYRRPFNRPDGAKPLPFSDFLRERGTEGPFIVNVTGHYMAVSHGEVCDAYENSLPRDIDAYLKIKKKMRYRNAWVWRWWRFEQVTS